MSKIRVLPENLANKIAAGEVIERPASVIKELIENSIDAHAHSIEISLAEGGIQRMQIRDDGEGIGREDAGVAFERHATSKIIQDTDLEGITTLGFRGEALPSIASVAKIRLITRTAAEEEGSELILEAGVLKERRGIGAPVGSLFEVRDLFYNVPARKKFLKSAGTELSHIRQVVFFQALSHPEIQFQLIHQDKTLLSVPAVSNRRDRFAQLYGDEAFGYCLEARRVLSEITLHLFISKVPLQKGFLKDQILFVNGRSVKNPMITRALYDAYGTFLVKGDHPFYLLYLEIDPTRVDVNVHPTKREVRFENAERLYQALKKGVYETLTGRSDAEENKERERSDPAVSFSSPSNRPDIRQPAVIGAYRQGSAIPGHPPTPMIERPQRNPEKTARQEETKLFPDVVIRSIGQVYGTFLLAEVDGEFVMVDQHTAHERILYELLLAKDRSQVSMAIQPLLIPRQVNLTPLHAAIIAEYRDSLSEAGVQLEPFGETVFLIRSVPVALSEIDFESFLVDLSEDLITTGTPSEAAPKLKIIASMACHGAVRAHQTLNKEQIEGLLHDYFNRNTPPTCPHGRPILIKYPLLELEKLFRRK